MKLKSDGKNGWKLRDAPQGAVLRRVTISFPSIVSHTGAGTKKYISGPATVNIRVAYADGTAGNVSGVAVEW